MKNLLLLTTLLLLNTINAQQTIGGGSVALLDNYNTASIGRDYNETPYKGTPYANEEFILATISTTNKSFPVRYNVFEDQMEVKRENSVLLLDKKQTDYVIHLVNKTYRSYKIENDYQFFAIASTNKHLDLLKKETKKFNEAKKAINSYSEDQPARFEEIKESYYIYTLSNGITQKLPQKEKDFLALFPKNKDKIKTYLKKNKLKLKKEEDLIKLLKYIDTLLETEKKG